MDSEYKSPFCRNIIDTNELVKKLRSGANHGLCGSQNLGNTCFMNSSIACLSNCTELTTYILTGQYKKDINKKNDEGLGGKLAESWYDLMERYWNSTNSSGNPGDVKKMVAKKVKKFSGYNQQDSNEFITEFLNLLSEDLNKNTEKKRTYKELDEKSDKESELDCAKRFWNLHVKRNDSIITDLFGGLYKSKVTCSNCGWVSITFDPFNTLTLAIPDLRNCYKDICLFYIPKYSIRKSLKVSLRIKRQESLDNICEYMKTLKDFKYSFNKIKFISVIDKQLKRFVDGQESYREKFIFLYNDEGGEAIPLYIHYKDFSAFPRLIFVNKNMSFGEFKRKIYYFARQHLINPLSDLGEKPHESEVDKELEKFQKEEIPYSEEKLIRLMDNEYKQMFNNKNLLNNFPYKILIKPRFESSRSFNLFDGNKNSCEELKEFGINSDSDSITKLVNQFTSENNSCCLVLNFDPDSEYVKSNIRLDSCDTVTDPRVGKEIHLTLEDCIKFYIEEEHLDTGNEWFCKKCKSKVQASKKIELYYLPRLLMICFKRFDKHYSKNDEYIDFPIENLDMGNYITGPDINKVKYDLFAVSQHYGSTGGGHYTAMCKNIDGNWYQYDDSCCSRSSAERSKTSAAYVLFYRKKNW